MLADHLIQQQLGERTPPDESARTLIEAALAAGSSDNVTALVLDVVDLPPADRDELAPSIATLAIFDLPSTGDVIEFAHELENGAMWAKPAAPTRRSLYDRNPLLLWKVISAGLFILVVILLAWRGTTGAVSNTSSWAAPLSPAHARQGRASRRVASALAKYRKQPHAK